MTQHKTNRYNNYYCDILLLYLQITEDISILFHDKCFIAFIYKNRIPFSTSVQNANKRSKVTVWHRLSNFCAILIKRPRLYPY